MHFSSLLQTLANLFKNEFLNSVKSFNVVSYSSHKSFDELSFGELVSSEHEIQNTVMRIKESFFMANIY